MRPSTCTISFVRHSYPLRSALVDILLTWNQGLERISNSRMPSQLVWEQSPLSHPALGVDTPLVLRISPSLNLICPWGLYLLQAVCRLG